MILKELLARSGTPGDVAAICAGYGVLFFVRVFDLVAGLRSTDSLAAGAIGAGIGFALKTAIHAALRVGHERRLLKRFREFVRDCPELDREQRNSLIRSVTVLADDRSLSGNEVLVALGRLHRIVHGSLFSPDLPKTAAELDARATARNEPT